MVTIYSQRDTVHLIRPQDFFQKTTLQNCKKVITDTVENISAKEKINSLNMGFSKSTKDKKCEKR